MTRTFSPSPAKPFRRFLNPTQVMPESYTPNLIQVLRSTIENVERTSGLRSDDQSLQELRAILNRRVADLQRAMASEFSDAASQPAENDREDAAWEIAS
jgi:hypothetical protein